MPTGLSAGALRDFAARVVRLERERALCGTALPLVFKEITCELRGMWFVVDRLGLSAAQRARLERFVQRERGEASRDDAGAVVDWGASWPVVASMEAIQMANGIKNEKGKAAKDQYEAKPPHKRSNFSGKGVGGGGDKMSTDKGIPGPKGSKK